MKYLLTLIQRPMTFCILFTVFSTVPLLAQHGKDEHAAPKKDEHAAPKKDEHAATPKKDEHAAPKKDEHAAPKKDEHAAPKKDEHAAPKKDEHDKEAKAHTVKKPKKKAAHNADAHGSASAHGGGHAEGLAPSRALALLREGNRRFTGDKPKKKNHAVEVEKTAKGQHPYAVIFSCSDSRVPPEHVFDTDLGELFPVRVAGNVIDDEQAGSAEYAVAHLGARLIVVMGHTACGAVTAAIDGVKEGNIGELVKHITPALDDVSKREFPTKAAKVTAGARANVLYQIQYLLSISDGIRDSYDAGKVKIMGGIYDLQTGVVEFFEAPEFHGVIAGGHGSGHGEGMEPDAALDKLWSGHKRFLANMPRNRRYSQDVKSLARGQKPYAIVLGCSDSRVPPEIVFDAGLGEIFTMRVAGNVSDLNSIASMEYAVEHLGAKLIVVLGHSACGAVTAAVGDVREGHVTDLVKKIKPALSGVLKKNYTNQKQQVNDAVRANILYQIEQLRELSPVIAEKIASGEVKIMGMMYNLETGLITTEYHD